MRGEPPKLPGLRHSLKQPAYDTTVEAGIAIWNGPLAIDLRCFCDRYTYLRC